MAAELWAYLNGQLIPSSQATLSLNDLGFVWGATATDRLRTFRQKLFRLEDHLIRFRKSCQLAQIPQMRSDEELAEAAVEVVAANAVLLPAETELSLVLFATPGVGGEPTLVMQAQPLDLAHYAAIVSLGASLHPVVQLPGVDPHIKHRSRLAWWIARQNLAVSAKPQVVIAEPLFTTAEPQQMVRETPSANILVEMDGGLITPPRTEILGGISLKVVEELSDQLGIPFFEREMPLAEVQSNAGECLLSNTSYCLAPVASIGGSPKPVGGPMFERLIRAWGDLVRVDIRRQFSG
jgi:branched-subunit amino acid aminotransferase/4-amino-4-deoxychorismate lyase